MSALEQIPEVAPVQPDQDSQGLSGLLDRLLGDRTLLRHVPYVVCVADREHRVLYLNRTVPGRRTDEFIGTSVFDTMPRSERERVREVLERGWRSGEPQKYTVHTVSAFWWENCAVPIKDNGRVVLMFITSLDVTQRVLAEEALRESEARLRHTLDATGVGTYVWDARADVLTWDGALCTLWGGDPSQAPRRYHDYLASVHPDDRERVDVASRRHLASGTFEETEYRLIRSDGEVRHVLAKATPLRDTQGEVVGFRGLLFDVTARKRLEEHLRHVQKMEAIGQLTAGIAHNFNNLLSVILPNISFCLEQVEGESKSRLEDVNHAANRAAELVQQLMLFARSDVRTPKNALCMVELCRRTADICRKTFHSDIAIELDVHEPRVLVEGDAVQLEQVLLNVCLNARDALIAADSLRPRIRIQVRGDAGRARVIIEDNGPGMDEGTAARVFEPFFTTKEAGRGTGLGLASAYAVLRDHEGFIRCQGRPGTGARFEISLPRQSRGSTPTPSPSAMEPSTPVACGTILLVDDESMVRRALRGILERAGYAVIEAASGAEALGVIGHHASHVDVMLVDQSMPGMRGAQLVELLAQRGCTVPVILMSGAPLAREIDVAGRLSKPMQSGELLAELARVIGKRDTLPAGAISLIAR